MCCLGGDILDTKKIILKVCRLFPKYLMHIDGAGIFQKRTFSAFRIHKGIQNRCYAAYVTAFQKTKFYKRDGKMSKKRH